VRTNCLCRMCNRKKVQRSSSKNTVRSGQSSSGFPVRGPPGVSKSILGHSSPLASEGINATYSGMQFSPRPIPYQVPIPVILGHAIAHEIGHALLRLGTHSATRLMSASWTTVSRLQGRMRFEFGMGLGPC
jgi:hypothetical protein